MSLEYSPRIITDGLVLCLDAFDIKSYPRTGTVWYDRSGKGNNGTLVNGVGYNSENGGNMVFDGVNDYINLGTQSNLTNIRNITACGWSMGESGFIINRYFNTTPANGWILSIGAISGRKNSSVYINVLSGYSPTPNEWVYTVGVISGNIWSIYVNGVLMNSVDTGSGDILFGDNFMYMGAVVQFSLYSNIKIAKTAIYNRALTPKEIQQNFNATRGRYGI